MSDGLTISGPGFALLAAVAYGFAGVAIARARPSARGDNGVFLSVLVTAVLTGGLWFWAGIVSVRALVEPGNAGPVALFALAGLFSTVLGRSTMYRATGTIGPVAASLLRRLTPVIALPMAFFLLAEWPDTPTLLGAGLVTVGVLAWLGWPVRSAWPKAGLWLGLGSAAFYAAAYTLRRMGLEALPDALLGTFIGALVGCLWFPLVALARPERREALRRLMLDRGRWHWLAALALSLGQTCQFVALKHAPVVVVAALGTLEVLFAAAFGALLIGRQQTALLRLALSLALTVLGTALMLG